jgi:hypothetical protein
MSDVARQPLHIHKLSVIVGWNLHPPPFRANEASNNHTSFVLAQDTTVEGRVKKMKVKIAALALGLFVALASTLIAQDEQKTTHKKVRTLSGCLEKGDGDKSYKLTDAKGDNWDIKSDAVALDQHVGHTVRITGVVSNAGIHGAKEDAKEKASENGVGDSAEHGHITATGLKMVSESCSK